MYILINYYILIIANFYRSSRWVPVNLRLFRFLKIADDHKERAAIKFYSIFDCSAADAIDL